mmetsp:Transcript_42667/g.112598  ORF Transcript_42667/g.112598 Transcript_42667/m.112598 type:complete len:200 (-) Transcript_42667:1442-2041(-)
MSMFCYWHLKKGRLGALGMQRRFSVQCNCELQMLQVSFGLFTSHIFGIHLTVQPVHFLPHDARFSGCHDIFCFAPLEILSQTGNFTLQPDQSTSQQSTLQPLVRVLILQAAPRHGFLVGRVRILLIVRDLRPRTLSPPVVPRSFAWHRHPWQVVARHIRLNAAPLELNFVQLGLDGLSLLSKPLQHLPCLGKFILSLSQ